MIMPSNSTGSPEAVALGGVSSGDHDGITLPDARTWREKMVGEYGLDYLGYGIGWSGLTCWYRLIPEPSANGMNFGAWTVCHWSQNSSLVSFGFRLTYCMT